MARDYPLSVVIPAHNAAQHLPGSLAALAENDLSGTEILVVDDASLDQTSVVAGEASLSADLRVISLGRQQGPAAARNAGAKESSHPHILFLDADVLLPPQSLHWIRESLALYSHRPEVAGVLGLYSAHLPWSDFLSNYKNLYARYLYESTDPLSPFIHTPIFCVRRAVLEAAGGFDAGLATTEDFRLGIVLGSRGYRFVIDRRIEGIHLKRYSLRAILSEDFRRIRDLSRVRLSPPQRRFSIRAHRPGRLLSVALPLPILALFSLSLWQRPLFPAALFLVLVFYGANLRFLNLCRRRRGAWFALKAAGFLFAEMLWAQAVLLWAWFPLRVRRDSSRA